MKKFCAAILLIWMPLVWGGFPYTSQTEGRPWPLPQSEQQGEGFMTMSSDTFQFTATGNTCQILQDAFNRYTNILFPNSIKSKASVTNPRSFANPLEELQVDVMTACEDYPYFGMDEQYELRICSPDNPFEATLISNSIWGALRGLETFSQLAVSDGSNNFNINCTQILDFPRFLHRGVMLDTSRHFLPIATIQQNLDLMAMNKFNVFHWHIVDEQSFPYTSAVYPDLSAMGAWSDIHTYSEEEMATVVEYARNLGIRVVTEFDTPGHTLSWGVGQPGLLTSCYSDGEPDGTYGPIDPSNEDNYAFLANLFQEISTRFPEHYLHLGGDEVPFQCWESNPDITDFMDSLGIAGNYTKLEEYYITRLLEIVSNLTTHNGYIVWEEVFDNGVELASGTIVHVWKYENNPDEYYPELYRVTDAGFNALLSSCWYLNYISYGQDWQKFYECDPHGFNGTEAQNNLVLGGEACMWGEYVDRTNVIARTWPRAAPVAERLWSPADATTSTDEATPRLEEHRCRLLRRGYDVEPFGPSYCEGVL